MHLPRTVIIASIATAIFHGTAAVSGIVTPTVVYPTGVYPDDVNQVQAAVDRGGTVILKSVNSAGVATSFNFGTGIAVNQSGGVLLNKDVEIRGEVTPSRRTTIVGGFLPIESLQPIKTTIENLDFESPFWTAITVVASTGSTIVGNVFHNIQPVQVRVPSGNIITFAQAIGFSGYDPSGAPAPNLITGNVVISGNTIDGARAIFSNGIQFDSFDADVEFVGNKITNVNDDTTQTGSGIIVIRASKTVALVGNFISPGPTTNFGADGIFIDGNREARYLVTGNVIETTGPYADGIDIAGGDPTGTTGTVKAQVFANSISTAGETAAGIFLYDLVTETDVWANQIKGSGINAMGISTYGFDTDPATDNRFTANDLRGFTSNESDLFYDTNTQSNIEVGFCRSVVDLGSGNSSTCAATSRSSASQASVGPNVTAAASPRIRPAVTKPLARQLPDRVTRQQVLR